MSAADREAVIERPPGTLAESLRRPRRRGPRSAEARSRRRAAFDARNSRHGSLLGGTAAAAMVTVDGADVLARRSRDPVFGAATFSGPPMASPVHGEELRARGSIRSSDGLAREHLQHDRDNGPCEAGPSIFKDFSLLQCNIRGFLSHRAELEGQLRLLPSVPSMVCLNETFLDESVSDDKLWLSGYRLLSRRDRCGRTGGGIACFAADRFIEHVALLEHSADFERTWHTIHSDIGPVLFGAWYRPPASGETASINACDEEWRRLSANFVATILAGDLNVHHTRWLRYSTSVSVEGSVLFRFCSANGLKQRVKGPTRDENLLDLVISDIDPRRVEVLPRISDHNMVFAEFNIGIPEIICVRRIVYDYSKANWADLQAEFADSDWSSIDLFDVDDAERFFHQSVFAILDRHVPRREISERKSSHLWINERCLEAIAATF